MHNTIAFCEVPKVTTEEEIAGVTDQNARVVGDDIFIGKYNHIVAMWGGGHSTQTLRLVSPSLRRLFSPYIHPLYSYAEDADWLYSPVLRPESPIALETNEALNALIKASEVHALTYNFCGVSLAVGAVTPVKGDIRTIVIEKTATSAIGAWTNHALSLPIDLPVGRYQVVGAMCRTSKVGSFRLVPVGADHRPGGAMDGGDKSIDCTGQRMGKMGIWCEFDQLTPPSLEICPLMATTWYSLKLDLIKVG